MNKKERGITLIALVITIIVLLILAGITMTLLFGTNNIIQRAQQATEELIKSEIKEEIGLAIFDIQSELKGKNPLEDLSNEAIVKHLPNKVNETIEIKDNLTGKYRGHDYWIDENYEVHIGNKGDLYIQLSVEKKIGTSSITVTATASSSQGEIIGYIYVVNGVESEQMIQTSYTVENLEAQTEYTIKVIVIDEKGNQKENQMNIRTEPRTYLYQEGEEAISLTGGWNQSSYNCGSFTKHEKLMQLYSNTTTATNKWWNSCVTNNEIDLSGYTKICFELEFDTVTYIGGSWLNWINMGISSNRVLDYDSTSPLCGAYTDTGLTNTKQVFKHALNGIEKGYPFIRFTRNSKEYYNVNCNIYNVWLEK